MDLDSSRFLYVLGVDPEVWAERWGLLAFTTPCYGCGEPRTATRPFFQGPLRGLQAEPCPCGTDTTPPYCLVCDPRVGDLLGLV